MELDNREIALFIWGGVFVAWALSVRTVRESLGPVFRSVATPAIGLPLVLMLGYVSGTVLILQRLGWWQPSDVKATVLWLIGLALVSFFEVPEVSRNPGRLKTVLLEIVGLAVPIEFIMNLFVIRLWLELLLIPFLTAVGLLLVVADRNSEHARTAGFLRTIQAIVGFGIALFVLVQLATRFTEIASVATFKNFALPIALSVTFLPFVYLMALYAAYDGVFRRLGWSVRDRGIRSYARRRTLVVCNIRLDILAEWSKTITRIRFETKESVDAALAAFRAPSHAA